MFFEYFYYRIAKLNFTKDYERAIISITMCQFMIILNIVIFLVIGPFEIKGKISPLEYVFFVLIFFVLDWYNNKLYNGRFQEIEKKWSTESENEKAVGLIKVFFFIILSFGLTFVNGWIYSRYQ